MSPISAEKLGSKGDKPFTVFIEGNIGSGKTTFLNHFQKFDEVCLLTEPVEKWRNCGGVNLLDLMYKEPYRWAMPFQTYVTLTMLNMHTQQTKKPVKLMERSMFSGNSKVLIANIIGNFNASFIFSPLLFRGKYAGFRFITSRNV